MPEYLLISWRGIHKALFHDENGKPVISLSTLMRKYGPELKELGVVFEWQVGRNKRRTIVGWTSTIKRYFILRQQEEYEKRKVTDFLGR